jgi:hypothetical protein
MSEPILHWPSTGGGISDRIENADRRQTLPIARILAPVRLTQSVSKPDPGFSAAERDDPKEGAYLIGDTEMANDE